MVNSAVFGSADELSRTSLARCTNGCGRALIPSDQSGQKRADPLRARRAVFRNSIAAIATKKIPTREVFYLSKFGA
jgi:hypothetical protein